MSLAVVGLWHLGTITSLCMSKIIKNVHAFDENINTVENLKNLKPPILERNVKNLLKHNLNRTLHISYELKNIKKFKNVWICFDSQISQNDKSESKKIYNYIQRILDNCKPGSNIIISTQIPLGTTKKLEKYDIKVLKKKLTFFYIPENLRLGKSVQIFLNPDRLVIGTRNAKDFKKIEFLFRHFNCRKYIVSPETAELTKHGINSFLACSISFINEIGQIAKKYDIQFDELSKCIQSDSRIGFKSYLQPGNPFSGGTLARDLNFLIDFSSNIRSNNTLIKSIYKSNKNHMKWAEDIIKYHLSKKKKKILFYGLSYKDNSSTFRRSFAYDLFKKFQNKANIKIFDEYLRENSNEIKKLKNNFIDKNNFNCVFRQSNLIIFFKKSKMKLPQNHKKKIVIDILSKNKNLLKNKNINYCSYEV